MADFEQGIVSPPVEEKTCTDQCFSITFLQKLIAEVLGTFFVIYAGCSAVVINLSHDKVITHPGVSIVWGLVVTVMIYSVGHISGAHFNPAVTLAFASCRRFPLKHGGENTKLECKRKISLLQKYEGGNPDMLKTEELHTNIETLQYDICCFWESISETNSDILKLVYDELHPQLILLSSGLMHMWKKMYECHQVQSHMAKQLSHLNNHPSVKPTTDYHRQSTTQLEAEVGGWYMSFCNLLKTQREYVQALNRWIQLTDYLLDGEQVRTCLSIAQHLCEHWMLAMDHLPDKVAVEAIKSFLSVIHSIVMQQSEEQMLQKKSERLEKKLQREIELLNEMEKKSETNIDSPNHPLAVKCAKIELFKKRVEDEKAKYMNAVQLSHSMTLNNLQKSLPNVFQALTSFSSTCVQTFEAINSHCKKADSRDDGETDIGDEPSSSVDAISTLGL